MSETGQEFVVLSVERATARALELTGRRFLTTPDHVELALLMEVIAGVREGVAVNDVWLMVLKKHQHAPISYADLEAWQHEAYSQFLEMAATVFARLGQLANGEAVTEATYVLYPATEEEEDSARRYADALLARAAMMVSLAYESPFAFRGEKLLDQLEYKARFALKCYFADQWFDDTYALGYAMMSQPLGGISAFGGPSEQAVLMRSMAQTVIDALAAYNDDSFADDVRASYGHTVTLFWPMLKAAVLFAVEDMNSPAGVLSPDDSVVNLIEQALLQGRDAYPGVTEGLKLHTTGSSHDAVRVADTPTEELIASFRKRVDYEHQRTIALRTII